MDQIQNRMNEMRAELNRQRDEIVFLRNVISTRQPAKPKPSLPDPEKFTGQAHKFDTWLPSIRAKLRVDGAAIGDDTAQFYYVYLNLDSHVQAMVLPQLSQADNDFNTILDQLSRVYDNPNKVLEAEDKLYALKQGSDSLQAYIAKFERTLYEAQGQGWPDINKISTLRNGLNSTLRSRLAQQLNLPRVYTDFLRVVQQLSGKSTTSSSSSTPYTIARLNTLHLHYDPMDVGSINVLDHDNKSSLVLTMEEMQTYCTPVDKQQKYARSTSPPLRQQYRSAGRCVRCGSADHWVRDCSMKPYNEINRRKQIGKLRKGKYVIEGDSDSEDWDHRHEDEDDDV